MLGMLEDDVKMVAESDAGNAKLSKMDMIPAIMYLKGERGICVYISLGNSTYCAYVPFEGLPSPLNALRCLVVGVSF